MAIVGVSPSSGWSGSSGYSRSNEQADLRQIRKRLDDLADALQAGDLSAAQAACSALQQLVQGAQSSSQSEPPANSTQSQFNADLAAVGKAIQSGDLNVAKSAFAKLQQDVQVDGMGHHALHAHSSPRARTPVGATTESSSIGTAINLTA
jgi:hypothetical protein